MLESENLEGAVNLIVSSKTVFLFGLGGSNIMGCYLHIGLVSLGGFHRCWFLCEVDVYDVVKTCEYMWLCYETYY